MRVPVRVKNLIHKANKRFFALLKYKRAGIRNHKLCDIFVLVMRSVLEYSSVVYHSQLSKYQTNLPERVQSRALRAIYSYEKDYTTLL